MFHPFTGRARGTPGRWGSTGPGMTTGPGAGSGQLAGLGAGGVKGALMVVKYWTAAAIATGAVTSS